MRKPTKAPKAVTPEVMLSKMQPAATLAKLKNVFFTGTQLYRRRDLPLVMPYLGRTAINELIRKGLFPEPIKLPNGIAVWPDYALQGWIVQCAAESEAESRKGKVVRA
jgi:predicted DNA-binding transcriptional regulator AlpA